MTTLTELTTLFKAEVHPSTCRDCDSDDLVWDFTMDSSAPAGNMTHRISELTVILYLGCEECSATVVAVRLDEVLRSLNTGEVVDLLAR